MFDSHFHLTDPYLVSQIKVNPQAVYGVEIGACFETLETVFKFAQEHENIYCTAGVHPEFANTFDKQKFEQFVIKHLRHPRFVALGECGIDYHRPDLPAREKQIEVFENQIDLAYKYAKPLVVHSREAWKDTFEVLVANREKLRNGVLIHCMSYTAENCQQLMAALPDVPVYFAFGGHLTYKNKAFLHETLRVVPKDRVLIETDAPYLAPVPKRGEINRPEYIQYTAKVMAEVLNLTIPEIESLTRTNALRFYQIKTA